MKAALLLLPFLFSIFLPGGQEDAIREIRFETFSRGYQKTITLRPDSIFISEQNPKAGDIEARRATEKREWEQLTGAVSDLPLTELDNLESPAKNRASDRALHSRITIKTGRGEYKSREFDGYNPHKKLDPLVEQIREIENNTKASDNN